MKYQMKSPASDRGLRSGPNTSFARVLDSAVPVVVNGYVARGTLMEGDELFTHATDIPNTAKTGDVWLHVIRAGGYPVDGWVAQRHMGFDICPLIVNDPLPPDPVVQAEITFVSATPITIVINGQPLAEVFGSTILIAKG
jgi:hypothetical protein